MGRVQATGGLNREKEIRNKYKGEKTSNLFGGEGDDSREGGERRRRKEGTAGGGSGGLC